MDSGPFPGTRARSPLHVSTQTRLNALLLILAYAGFVSLGLPDAAPGIAWPSLRDTYHLPQAGLGSLLVASMTGYLASSMLASRTVRLVGVGGLLIGSTALVTLALTGFVFSTAWLFFLGCACVWGMGSGAIDTGLNAYAARHFSLRHMNWLHGFYTVGASCGPLIMTTVIAGGHSWRVGYGIIAGILLAMTLAFAATRRMWEDGAPDTGSNSRALDAETATLGDALHMPLVWLQALLFFVLTGLEATAGQWSFTYFSEYRGVHVGTAGAWVTTYWVVFATGRFLLGAIAGHVGAGRLLTWSGCLVVAGCLLYAFSPPVAGAVGLALIGFGLAPMYPTLMARTPKRLGHHLVHTAVGIQVCAAVIGAAALPALTGLVVGVAGLRAVGVAELVFACVFVVLHTVLVNSVRGAGTRPTGV